MKIIHGVTMGALGCICFAAIAQQQRQSPFQPPAVAAPAMVSNPLVLNLTSVVVTDESGQPLGPIQSIILNPSGCVDMAVMSLGGDKLVPVPWTLVSGMGGTRGQMDASGQVALSLKVDRNILVQAPSVTIDQVSQLTQPQVMQRVYAFYGPILQRTTAVGGTGSQTGVNVGDGVNAKNGTSIGITNQSAIVNQDTNLSPTGPTNGRPGRPAFETNRPPSDRPPTTTPDVPSTPGTGASPNQPGQPIQ